MYANNKFQDVVEQIFKIISKQANQKAFSLDFKASHLKNETVRATHNYHQFMAESKGNVISLNGLPNSKLYNSVAGSPKEEYERMVRNCRKIEQEQIEGNADFPKMTEKWLLDLKACDEKFIYEEGKEGWVLAFKKRLIKRQVSLLVDGKQVRFDMNAWEPVITDASEKLVKFRDKLTEFIKIMRFKHTQRYHIDLNTKIHITYAYETEEPADYDKLRQAILSEDEDDVCDFIRQTIEKSKKGTGAKSVVRYEIEMKITEKGNADLMKMNKEQLSAYLKKVLLRYKQLLTTEVGSKASELEKMMAGLKI